MQPKRHDGLSPSLSGPLPKPGQTNAQPQQADAEEDWTDEGQAEVVDVNPLTKTFEFHGNTSSVAFLGRLHKECTADDGSGPHEPSPNEHLSLVGAFHNADFSPLDSTGISNAVLENQFFCPQAYVFLDSYFTNLHHIYPLIEREPFMRRCEDLWQGYHERQSSCFIALYYSVMSLGALVRNWNGERLNGMSRFGWSRMLFERAQAHLGRPAFANDIEAIQCLFMMAKICQNELNPNFSYMYLGMAIRTALSAGINRNTPVRSGRPVDPDAAAKSRTWWGLYSLEIELSFALGRPDTLGMDEHHNRPMPPKDDSPNTILREMVTMARIIRAISVSIYLRRLTLADKLATAFDIEKQMDEWVAQLPARIRPTMTPDVHSNGSLNDPLWAPPQRLVLQTRRCRIEPALFS